MSRMMVPTFIALALATMVVVPLGASAQDGGLLPGAKSERKIDGGSYTCTARNALGTQQCSTTCPSRDTADCEDSDGGSPPTCQCTGG